MRLDIHSARWEAQMPSVCLQCTVRVLEECDEEAEWGELQSIRWETQDADLLRTRLDHQKRFKTVHPLQLHRRIETGIKEQAERAPRWKSEPLPMCRLLLRQHASRSAHCLRDHSQHELICSNHVSQWNPPTGEGFTKQANSIWARVEFHLWLLHLLPFEESASHFEVRSGQNPEARHRKHLLHSPRQSKLHRWCKSRHWNHPPVRCKYMGGKGHDQVSFTASWKDGELQRIWWAMHSRSQADQSSRDEIGLAHGPNARVRLWGAEANQEEGTRLDGIGWWSRTRKVSKGSQLSTWTVHGKQTFEERDRTIRWPTRHRFNKEASLHVWNELDREGGQKATGRQ